MLFALHQDEFLTAISGTKGHDPRAREHREPAVRDRLPRAVPSLDDLAKDPALAEGLPRSVVADLFRVVGRLHVELHARLLTEANAQPAETSARRLYDVQTAAKILGVSKDWVYRHGRMLPFRVRIGRRVMFSPDGLQDYIRRRTGAG